MATFATSNDMNDGRERGFLGRMGDRFVAARMRHAERTVAAYLLSLDDATLARLGENREEIAARDPMGHPFL